MTFTVWVKSVTGVSVLLVAALTGCGSPIDGGVRAEDAQIASTPASVSAAVNTSEQVEGGTASPAGSAAPIAPGEPPPGGPVPSETSATEVVSLVAVDASGSPVNGFTLSDPAPVGQLDCRDGGPSRSADTPGIYHCGASAAAADVCWPTPSGTELLCADDPWQRELRLYKVDPPLEPIGMSEHSEPWALELADGRQCRIRVGGAWGGRSDGLVGAYSCNGGSEVVLQAPDAGTAIDRATDTWRVAVGELGAGTPEFPPPAVVAIRAAYFASTP